VQQEFEAYLKCGRLEEGFLRVRCEQCHAEKLVAFSCKKRGFCPSCGGRRMAETAALLADEVLPDRPLRQWMLSLPHALRFLLATHSEALTLVLGEVYRTISRHLIGKAGLTRTSGAHGVFAPHSQYRAAVTPAQRGRGAATAPVSGADPTKPATPRHVAMRWATRLKRVFGVEIECCARCGGQLKIIASIEEPQLIAKILSHLERAAPEQYQSELALRKRGPPGQSSLL
jgi:ribosomal protein S27E